MRVRYSANLAADIEAHLADEDAAIEVLPSCCVCQEHIQQEDAVCLDGDWYCDDCLRLFRRSTNN